MHLLQNLREQFFSGIGATNDLSTLRLYMDAVKQPSKALNSAQNGQLTYLVCIPANFVCIGSKVLTPQLNLCQMVTFSKATKIRFCNFSSVLPDLFEERTFSRLLWQYRRPEISHFTKIYSNLVLNINLSFCCTPYK